MAGLTLRREARESQLYLDAVVQLLGKKKVEQTIGTWQFENETVIDMLDNRRDLPQRAFGAIRALWPGRGKFVTLEDLTFRTREEIAGLPGVGSKAMEFFDQAMADHGLTWAEGGEERGEPSAAAG